MREGTLLNFFKKHSDEELELIKLIGRAKDTEKAVEAFIDIITYINENGADEAKANEWLKAKYGVTFS